MDNNTERDELSFDDLQNVIASPDNGANYNAAMEHQDLYRKKQIEELKSLKEEILGKDSLEKDDIHHTR